MAGRRREILIIQERAVSPGTTRPLVGVLPSGLDQPGPVGPLPSERVRGKQRQRDPGGAVERVADEGAVRSLRQCAWASHLLDGLDGSGDPGVALRFR